MNADMNARTPKKKVAVTALAMSWGTLINITVSEQDKIGEHNYVNGPIVVPLILTNNPEVVVQMSPSTGDDGALPCGTRKLETPVVPAARMRLVVVEASTPMPVTPAR